MNRLFQLLASAIGLVLALCTSPLHAAQNGPLKAGNAVSRHGDWAAIPLDGDFPVPNVVVEGKGHPGDDCTFRVSHRSPNCTPPIVYLVYKGELAADGSVLPLTLRVDKTSYSVKGHALIRTGEKAKVTYVEPEFADPDAMIRFVKELPDSKKLEVVCGKPGAPKKHSFDLTDYRQTMQDAAEACVQANRLSRGR